MHTLVAGIRIFFDVEGPALVPRGPTMVERPRLVLIHGAEVDHSFFKPWLAPLADVAQLVYVDVPGHGRSDAGTPEDWGPDRFADRLHAFCIALGIERPVVLGSSMGGRIAMSWAARYPDQPGALILVNTVARTVRERHVRVFERLGGPDSGRAAAAFFADPTPENNAAYARLCYPLTVKRPYSEAEIARSRGPAPGVLDHLRSQPSRDFRDQLARVRCPTLVMTGADDPFATVEDLEEMVAALPEGASRCVIPDAGHGAYRDNPDAFLAEMRSFLASIDLPGEGSRRAQSSE